jgi:hypothetical protein
MSIDMKQSFNDRIQSALPKVSVRRMSGLRMAVAAAILGGVTLCQAARIDRIDIYDKSDNHLLFVTFAYNAGDTNIGRSVFASDSTFLRSTKFQTSGTGVKETSVDFDDNLVFSTTISAATGGKTSFSTVDQFGLDQYGGAMSYTIPSPNNYDLSQSNGTVCKEQYQFGADGTLLRINVLDKNGTLIYYALPNRTTGSIARLPGSAAQLFLITANRGRIKIRLGMMNPGRVCGELYTPAGRRAAGLVDGIFDRGNHAINVNALGSNGNRLGNGAYIIRLTIDGVTMVSRKILLQR